MKKDLTEKALARKIQAAEPGTVSVDVPSSRAIQLTRSVLYVLIGVVIGLVIWEICALVFNSKGSTLGFPDPITAFKRLGEYLFTGKTLYGHTVYEHVLASMQRLLIAFGLAALVGITLGSIMGYFQRIYAIAIVPVSIYQMIPGLAWLPVAILMFGLGDDAAIFIIFAVSSMVITIGVSGGIRMVPDVMVRAAKMSGASSFTVFIRVLIPQAAGSIVNALRLGMSSAWRVLIAAEMIVGTGVGMGYSIQLTRDLLDYVGAFACITVICLFGLFLDRVLLASIERWMNRRQGTGE